MTINPLDRAVIVTPPDKDYLTSSHPTSSLLHYLISSFHSISSIHNQHDRQHHPQKKRSNTPPSQPHHLPPNKNPPHQKHPPNTNLHPPLPNNPLHPNLLPPRRRQPPLPGHNPRHLQRPPGLPTQLHVLPTAGIQDADADCGGGG